MGIFFRRPSSGVSVAAMAALLLVLPEASQAFRSSVGTTFTNKSPFLPATTLQYPSITTVTSKRRHIRMSASLDEQWLSEECLITPEGFGFSAPAQRILDEADRVNGYYKAGANDSVLDVMENISNSAGPHDVALVFDNTALVGLFTETDYIQNFSTRRAAVSATEQQSAEFLAAAAVSDFVTPAANLVGLLPTDTANVAIALMQQKGVRHLIVADKLQADRTVSKTSQVLGVISMQDVMAVIQKDERLSLKSLQAKYPNIRSPMDRMREEMKSNANKLADNPTTAKEDIIKVGASVLSAATIAAFFSQSVWLHGHADAVMILIFVLGYIGIIFEEVFEFNKAGVALLMSTGLWVTYADYFDSAGTASAGVLEQLSQQLAEVADICFFLLAASTIVEVVDSHQGFKVVTNKITTTSKKELFWTIGFLTFFFSAILNNLTVTIVMVSLLRKLVPNDEERRLFGAMVVVAANAGGVWTPIGDVTTTMLWINNQLSTVNTITDLALPSLVCLVTSLAFLVQQVEEDDSLANSTLPEASPLSRRGQLVFWAGIASLLAVPVFNELTGLPPYLAMLTGLGAMWTLTDVIHMGEDEEEGLKVPAALSRLDTSGILFFLGILMSIGVLDKSGLLKQLAVILSDNLPSLDIIATAIGLFSALIDNVPLVAATM
jgi:Na+/H+ antiporter NhaD/arsenite permease-like protein/CBS domain-containing protein